VVLAGSGAEPRTQVGSRLERVKAGFRFGWAVVLNQAQAEP
jgi:hypothetical protein